MSILIPNPPNGKPLDDSGNWTPEWFNYFSQLSQEVQRNYNNQGISVPQQPIYEIDTLTDPSKSTSAIIYDSTDGAFKGNIDGTWYTFILM